MALLNAVKMGIFTLQLLDLKMGETSSGDGGAVFGGRGRGRGGDCCGEEGLCWSRVVQGRNCQVVKINEGLRGRGREGTLVQNFPRESNIFNVQWRNSLAEMGFLRVASHSSHGLCNGNCSSSEVGIDMGGVFLSQVLCQIGDAVLSLPMVESGERKDMAGSISVAVDRCEDGLPFVGLHLEDQAAEGCPIVRGTEYGGV